MTQRTPSTLAKVLGDLTITPPSGESVLDYAYEVELQNNDGSGFQKVRETLKRMGIVSSTSSTTLNQTCHIFKYKGKFYLVHFKMMFMFDGQPSSYSVEDADRLNITVGLLQKWDLLKVLNPSEEIGKYKLVNDIRVIKYDEANNWKLRTFYNINRHLKEVQENS